MADQQLRPTLLAGIAVGGSVGSLGRYGVDLALPPAVGGWPWATFIVNVSGSLAMGVLVGYLMNRPGAHPFVRPVLGVGLLGGWTTFSSFAVDAIALAGQGQRAGALSYVISTFVVCVLATAVGERMTRRGGTALPTSGPDPAEPGR